MTAGAMDPAVERFLLDSIDTVPHLEALLLLFQSPATVWTVVQLAARIYVNEKQASTILEDLTRRSLIVRIDQQTPATYQYVARSPEQSALLDKVAHSYRTQLVQLTRFIHSNASGSVRDFARAFRLKDKD
jgi:DNA-binding MarR family transcriptional regulator